MVAFRPSFSKEDVTVRLLATFKRLISEGALVAGSRVPSERELAEKFQVSRSSLRQALKVLEIMGVISQRVGDGTYLNSVAPRILGEPMEFLILLNGITYYELMEARLVVEPELAARAAIRATEDDLAILRRETLAIGRESRRSSAASADLAFHHADLYKPQATACAPSCSPVIHQSAPAVDRAEASQLVPPSHTAYSMEICAIRRRQPERRESGWPSICTTRPASSSARATNSAARGSAGVLLRLAINPEPVRKRRS